MLSNNTKQKGVGTLIVVLILGGIIVEIALAGILAVTFLNSQNYGVRVSAQALASAQSGFEEAFVRIIRNKNLLAGSPVLNSDWNYFSLQFPDVSVKTIACKKAASGASVSVNPISGDLSCNDNSPLPPPDVLYSAKGGIYEIVSRGSSFTKRRQLRAFVAVDPVTGVATLQSLQEVPYDN